VSVDPKALELSFTRIKMDPKVTDELLSELNPVAESMKGAGKIGAVPDFKKLVRMDFYERAVKLRQASR
jgi:NitT/TauT family transport system substrate-binding protein